MNLESKINSAIKNPEAGILGTVWPTKAQLVKAGRHADKMRAKREKSDTKVAKKNGFTNQIKSGPYSGMYPFGESHLVLILSDGGLTWYQKKDDGEFYRCDDPR